VRFDSLFRAEGLTIVGIHTPEFPPYAGEHDRGNVARALSRYAIRSPNAQDNDRRTWDLYGIRFWPSLLLAACDTAPVASIVRHDRGGPAILAVLPAPGIRLNARVPPALELADESTLRFGRGAVTPDSSYLPSLPGLPCTTDCPPGPCSG
jgi:hypothetical protein